MAEKNQISYSQEILRKSIHMMSLSIPIVYSQIDKETMLILLSIFTGIFLTGDILSKVSSSFKVIVDKVFGKMMRAHEKEKKYTLNGASWVFIAALTCLLVFPKLLFITGFSILIISDISAALFGRKFGKHKFLDKSLEGSLAFYISALLVITVIGFLAEMPWTYFAVSYFSAIFATVSEAASKRLRIDDNFSIPFSMGAIMWLLDYLLRSQSMDFIKYLN